MNFIRENRAVIVVVAVIAGLLVFGVTTNTKPGDSRKQDTKTAQATKKDAKQKAPSAKQEAPVEYSVSRPPAKTQVTTTDGAVRFGVAAGESYTTLARKAVQGAQKGLSKAQIIAAETYITQAAGSPAIDAGETVVVRQSSIDSAIKRAQALSKSELAAWEKYVPYVVF